MRRYLPKEDAEAALKMLDAQIDHDALRQQADRIRSRPDAPAANYMAKTEIHKLWSDGAADGTFENTHECWKFFKTVG